MNIKDYDMGNIDIAWCPGCGNFPILQSLKKTLTAMNIKPEELVLVSGIGQAAKIPHYLRCNMFNGLHGRSLPVATGIKASNPDLKVIAASGDGCMYGEGGNHFIHTIRRNPDITIVVHDNMVYGLTKGQASPTSRKGFKTPVQLKGVFLEPFNPLAVAISLNASFVARAYCGDIEKTSDILKQAINHKGLAIVDVLQVCVTFNKLNTYQWFKENTYYLEDEYDYSDRVNAFSKVIDENKFALGIIYKDTNPDRKSFEENVANNNTEFPLYKYKLDQEKLKKLIESKK